MASEPCSLDGVGAVPVRLRRKPAICGEEMTGGCRRAVRSRHVQRSAAARVARLGAILATGVHADTCLQQRLEQRQRAIAPSRSM